MAPASVISNLVDASVVWILAGFVAGSIPFGYLVASAYGKDIRSLGSGNIGMTNVWRTLGWKPGLTVLTLDVLKGWLPVYLVLYKYYWPYIANENTHPFHSLDLWWWRYLPLEIGVAAMLGHTFSPWLKFKGGKGVATGLGVAIALYAWWILVPLAVFLIVLALTRMVSASSLLAAASLAAISYFDSIRNLWGFGLVILLLVFYTHRSNIRRILNGTENKVSFGRKSKIEA